MQTIPRFQKLGLPNRSGKTRLLSLVAIAPEEKINAHLSKITPLKTTGIPFVDNNLRRIDHIPNFAPRSLRHKRSPKIV
jgi:hypothetical protein